ncbi:MAG TPA: sulfatase [Phycisphaerales bacterium]|nr:sulfatase [Phycisphaerales bacterium]HCD35156.1 sulfatase [Phycisphaerales bacterium]|tara:strand:+ start:1122 stop:2588 length:1467 start_codon:yes stop_codon:yes gene_type:complete
MNIIYYNPDELRADVLGCYGHPLVKTPNIDRLAAKGTTFENCFVQHTVCSPSRCSFLTGWYPHVRGHRSLWHLLKPDEPNTLKYLKAHGHHVNCAGKNDALQTDSFADSVHEIHMPQSDCQYGRLHDDPDHPGFMNFLYKPMNGDHRDMACAEVAAEYVRNWKPGDKPFMWYITPSLPHCPYSCPEPWYSMYSPDEIPPLLQKRIEKAPSFHKWIRHHRKLDQCADDLKKIMAVYLGMVSYVDHIFGKLLDALETSPAADCTTVMFFSDHGDWAGHRGLVEKWSSALDDDLTRVPLIISTPGGKQGHRVSECVELQDIAATTAELAGYELKHTQFGRSLVPQLHGAAGDSHRHVFAEGGYDLPGDYVAFEHHGGHEGHQGYVPNPVITNSDHIYYPKTHQQQMQPESICRALMVRTMDYKLIRRNKDISELYDLRNDPTESVNLIDDPIYSDVQSKLSDQLLRWMIDTSDVMPYERDPRGWPEQLVYS